MRPMDQSAKLNEVFRWNISKYFTCFTVHENSNTEYIVFRLINLEVEPELWDQKLKQKSLTCSAKGLHTEKNF